KNIVLLTEINGFFDASLLHNYMDVIKYKITSGFFNYY
ncbi:citrate transporter, partial [Enterococcus faecium]